jgi:hypothetical protein
MHGTFSKLASLPHRQTPAIIPKTLVWGEVVDPLDNLTTIPPQALLPWISVVAPGAH